MASHQNKGVAVSQLLTESAVAEITQIPAGTLRRWRCAGQGLPHIKMGPGKNGLVRYDAVVVQQYIDSRRRYPVRASVEINP